MILDCGHEPSEHSSFTTGYGTSPDGKTYCYQCCADRDKQQMRDDGRTTLYLVKDGESYKATNWPASLTFHPFHVRKGHHNIARTRYDFWFSFEGQPWHGVQYGENSQVAHCRRVKS